MKIPPGRSEDYRRLLEIGADLGKEGLNAVKTYFGKNERKINGSAGSRLTEVEAGDGYQVFVPENMLDDASKPEKLTDTNGGETDMTGEDDYELAAAAAEAAVERDMG